MSHDTSPRFFPELDDALQKEAECWLREYLALVIRIAASSKRESSQQCCPHPLLDASTGSGTIGTPASPPGPTGEL
jgi:hypothetical protein